MPGPADGAVGEDASDTRAPGRTAWPQWPRAPRTCASRSRCTSTGISTLVPSNERQGAAHSGPTDCVPRRHRGSTGSFDRSTLPQDCAPIRSTVKPLARGTGGGRSHRAVPDQTPRRARRCMADVTGTEHDRGSLPTRQDTLRRAGSQIAASMARPAALHVIEHAARSTPSYALEANHEPRLPVLGIAINPRSSGRVSNFPAHCGKGTARVAK